MHMDKEVAITLAGTFLLYVVAGRVVAYFPRVAVQVGPVTLAVVLALIAWQLAASGPRFMRREIIRTLARSLKPLRPTQQELEAVISEIRQGTHKIGRKLEAVEVLEQIRLVGEPPD
jgi:hypothetical protein